jgi:glycosyltransferase involved in cell wall biosynthesis
MLQELTPHYDVTLLCWKPPDLAATNRFFGTSLQARAMKIITIPWIFRRIAELDPDPGSIQGWCLLMRRCKQLQSHYDLVLGTELEADYGVPGIQYIHSPGLAAFYPPPASALDPRWWRRCVALVRGELRPWMLLADFSFARMRMNTTLTSSVWIGEVVAKAYAIQTETLYPPAGGNFVRTPWAQRDDGFVCVGRLSRTKRIEWMIDTLARVKAQHPGLKFHIAGSLDSAPDAQTYRRQLAELVRSHSQWVHLHDNLSRDELLCLLARNRYGIHANLEEHFGIAVAEMLLAGSIPFVYHQGGPVEIVGGDPHLTYASSDDAVEKILHMMSDGALQQNTLESLAARAPLFTVERFMRDVRALVARELHRRAKARAS